MGQATRTTLRYSKPQAQVLAYWCNKYGFTKTDSIRQFLVRGLADPPPGPPDSPAMPRDQMEEAYIRLSEGLLRPVDALASQWGKSRAFTLRAILWHASAPVGSETLSV